MQGKIEWLKEQGWELVRKPPRKPRRLWVVTGGRACGCRPVPATGFALTGLLDRIDWEDYILNGAVRRHVMEILYKFSDGKFCNFRSKYEYSRSSSKDKQSSFT